MNETTNSTPSVPTAAGSSTSEGGPARSTASRAGHRSARTIKTNRNRITETGHWFAVWFGCGLSPVAPGTAGSLAAIAIGFFLVRFAGFAPWHFFLLALPFSALGVWASDCEERWTGKTDPGSCVIDEVAGQWIALGGAMAFTWPAWLIAFALFRLFDIWKPFPIDNLQNLRGGWGIMADDVVAGIYAALVLYAAGCFNLY